MRLMRVGIILGVCIVMLFGCSSKAIHNDSIYSKSTEVSNMIDGSKWDEAKQTARSVNQLYKDRKWKYQLLGNETEYQGLDKAIRKLQVSLDEKDKKEAKRNVAMIEHYVESLYFK